jgi:hypothetical protein
VDRAAVPSLARALCQMRKREHVPEFLFKPRIIREFERLHAMRLQIVLRPDALHRTSGENQTEESDAP